MEYLIDFTALADWGDMGNVRVAEVKINNISWFNNFNIISKLQVALYSDGWLVVCLLYAEILQTRPDQTF